MKKIDRNTYLCLKSKKCFDVILGEDYHCADNVFELDVCGHKICIVEVLDAEPRVIDTDMACFVMANNTVLAISKLDNGIVEYTLGLTLYDYVKVKDKIIFISDCELLCMDWKGNVVFRKELSGILQNYEVENGYLYLEMDNGEKYRLEI